MLNEPYLYSGTNILINRLDIRDRGILETVERELVARRILEGAPRGDFDADHLRAIHRYLFQDVYDWAGHPVDLEQLSGPAWIEASHQARTGDRTRMREMIETAVDVDMERRPRPRR